MFCPCPKPEPRILRDAAIKREEEKAWRACKARVTKRDGKRCRVCGKAGAEHHHVLPRSLGGRDIDSNVVLLCKLCHRYRHDGLIRITGTGKGWLLVWFDARVSRTGKELSEAR
jgi:5-methylcytosine-specific restriction endonuclease McrA